MNLSKHLKKIVEDESNRIRHELIQAAVAAFRAAGFVVTVSLDQNNRSEKEYVSEGAYSQRALSSDGAVAWLFAYKPGVRNMRDMPVHWVQLNTSNVENIITDYNTGAESILKPVKAKARKYD